MKYAEQKELVSALRELADFYERPQSIALPMLNLHISEYVGVWGFRDNEYGIMPDQTRTKMRRILKALGSCEKVWDSSAISLTKKVGAATLVFRTPRESVCKKVPTGEKRIIPSTYIPERVEEEFEWVCEEVSLLADTSDANTTSVS